MATDRPTLPSPSYETSAFAEKGFNKDCEPVPNLPHTIASLRRRAQMWENSARKVAAQAKACERMIARIQRAHDAYGEETTKLDALRETIRMRFGTRT